jgi:DNA-binding NtrC family response regulator
MEGTDRSVNVATAIPTARYTALLVENEKISGLESALREQGCSVRRATSRAAAQDALEGADLVVVTTQGLSEGDVTELVGKAILSSAVLVVTEDTEIAVKAAKLGAATSIGGSSELAAVHIGQQIGIIELKRKFARQSGAPSSMAAPTSGVVQRRSTPLPKEATPDALEALVEAAELLVPMHRFQRVYVDYALRRFGGNKVHTAAALGIDRRTIQRWARARSEQPSANQAQTSTHS